MIRVSALVIGLFLVALWIAGLSTNAAMWLTWLNGLGAIFAFVVASMPVTGMAQRGDTRAVIGGLTSLGLFVLWIIGLVTHAQAWLVWCTFAAACAMAFIAFGGGVRTTRSPVQRVA